MHYDNNSVIMSSNQWAICLWGSGSWLGVGVGPLWEFNLIFDRFEGIGEERIGHGTGGWVLDWLGKLVMGDEKLVLLVQASPFWNVCLRSLVALPLHKGLWWHKLGNNEWPCKMLFLQISKWDSWHLIGIAFDTQKLKYGWEIWQLALWNLQELGLYFLIFKLLLERFPRDRFLFMESQSMGVGKSDMRDLPTRVQDIPDPTPPPHPIPGTLLLDTWCMCGRNGVMSWLKAHGGRRGGAGSKLTAGGGGGRPWGQGPPKTLPGHEPWAMSHEPASMHRTANNKHQTLIIEN